MGLNFLGGIRVSVRGLAGVRVTTLGISYVMQIRARGDPFRTVGNWSLLYNVPRKRYSAYRGKPKLGYPPSRGAHRGSRPLHGGGITWGFALPLGRNCEHFWETKYSVSPRVSQRDIFTSIINFEII